MISVLLAAAVASMDPPPVDPASVQIPDLAGDSRPLGDDKKFFVWRRSGATFDEALTDLRFCFRYVGLGMWNPPPAFVPWTEGNGLKERVVTNNYGLIGALMGGLVEGSLERSVRQINMTSCMLPRGYSRYRVSEAMWRTLNGKDVEQSILMQAKIASGPVPATPRLLP